MVWSFQRIYSHPLRRSANSRIKNTLHWNIIFHTDDMSEPAQVLNVNAMNYIQIIQELLRLIVRSNKEIIANTGPKILRRTVSSITSNLPLHPTLTASMFQCHIETQGL